MGVQQRDGLKPSGPSSGASTPTRSTAPVRSSTPNLRRADQSRSGRLRAAGPCGGRTGRRDHLTMGVLWCVLLAILAPSAADAHTISKRKAEVKFRAYAEKRLRSTPAYSARVTKERRGVSQVFCRPVKSRSAHGHVARCYYLASVLEWMGQPAPGMTFPDEYALRFCSNPGASSNQRKRARVRINSKGRLSVVTRSVHWKCRLHDLYKAHVLPKPAAGVQSPVVTPPSYATEPHAAPQLRPPVALGRPPSRVPAGAPTGPPGAGLGAFGGFPARTSGLTAGAAQAAGDGSYFYGCMPQPGVRPVGDEGADGHQREEPADGAPGAEGGHADQAGDGGRRGGEDARGPRNPLRSPRGRVPRWRRWRATRRSSRRPARPARRPAPRPTRPARAGRRTPAASGT